MQAAALPDDELPTGAVLDGRFRVERRVGAGAMGAVFLATTTSGERRAIKVLGKEALSDPELLLRFEREGHVALDVEAPNVTRVLELGVDAPTSSRFIVMEWLVGSDCEALVASVGPLSPEIAARIVSQAARGVTAAHARGIVHRDLKPANLFLHHVGGAVERDDAVVVKVCDFGLARASSPDDALVTRSGTLMGSPIHMSPEQIRGSKDLDARADVWGLGMVLWTLLAGRPAFGDVSGLAELSAAICTRPVPWIQDAAPWVDPALARVVHGALLSDRDARCPSTDELVDALRRFLGRGEDLRAGDFSGIPEPRRAMRAPSAVPGASWEETMSADGPPNRAMNDPEIMALVGATLGRRYRLDGILGAGGMGAVYLATTASGERFAVKTLVRVRDRHKVETLRRFVREARSTMSIDSPHVVRIVDVATDEERGFPFIVMELLTGTDLGHVIKEHGALDPPRAVAAFVQACRGISAAHACGIVHRDVKPGNIFLHREGARFTVKICDFGIAKNVTADPIDQTSTDLTRSGGVLGSPVYMSPEQARSAKNVDHTSDVWSLGVTLYEALSGQRPWRASTTVGDVLVAICTEDPPPLQDLAPWIEPGLAEAVHKALRRNAAERHASMAAFERALAPFAAERSELETSALGPVSASRRSLVAARARKPEGPAAALGVTTTQPASTAGDAGVGVATTREPVSGPTPESAASRVRAWSWRNPALFAGIAAVGVVGYLAVLGGRRAIHSDAPAAPESPMSVAASAPAALDAGLTSALAPPPAAREPPIASSASPRALDALPIGVRPMASARQASSVSAAPPPASAARPAPSSSVLPGGLVGDVPF